MLAGPFHRKLHLSRFWKEVSESSKQTTGGKAFQSVVRRMREQGTTRQKLGVAEGSKAGHSGWGPIAKDECPAKALGLYSASREWKMRSMLETEGRINGEEQDSSQATGDLCSVWGVKEDAKGPNDSPLAKTRRAIRTFPPPPNPWGSKLAQQFWCSDSCLLCIAEATGHLTLQHGQAPSRLSGWTRH